MKKQIKQYKFVKIVDPDGVSQPYDDSMVKISISKDKLKIDIWGNDDQGYYKVFTNKADVVDFFRHSIPETISYHWMIAQGFLDWNSDLPIRLPKGY